MFKCVYFIFLLFAILNSVYPYEEDIETNQRNDALNEVKVKTTESRTKTDEIEQVDNKNINSNEIQKKLDSAQNEIKRLEEINKRLMLITKYPTLCIPDDKDKESRTISLPGQTPFPVHCNSEGWIVCQRRNRKLGFRQKWHTFAYGIGNLFDEEYFLGLYYINIITSEQQHELMISLTDFYNKTVHAHYTDFKIDDDNKDYELKSLGLYSGDAGDGLRDSEGFKFHRQYFWFNDAKGWWESKSDETNLFESRSGIKWNDKYYDKVQMMIRPVIK